MVLPTFSLLLWYSEWQCQTTSACWLFSRTYSVLEQLPFWLFACPTSFSWSSEINSCIKSISCTHFTNHQTIMECNCQTVFSKSFSRGEKLFVTSNGMSCLNNVAVIPFPLQRLILSQLHFFHSSLRHFAWWWPGIDDDILLFSKAVKNT